ncbi:HNH endonuclease [Morganella morganii]|uniref:HNH endonuclease n=1 Tax=Morganella morganii TaxID=582 RepID=UPI0014192DCF|nr:HNH endonuclease [Morganella morganii]NIH19345.1 HNH endonuclease [Morganella morganii]
MTTPLCALCDIEITEENDTKEHIIPNAIGGRRKIKKFICKNCNNISGNDWESALAKQLNPLCLFFGISRERGESPSQLFETTGGDKLKLNLDGSMDIEKPLYSETLMEPIDSVKIQIKARSISEAKRMLLGLKRKYPRIDLNKLIKNAKSEQSYCPDMLKFHFSFGGQEAGRSIVKSALALAVSSGIPEEICIEAKNYLRNKDSEACFGYFYESDLIKNRPEGIPFHCVSIKGCCKTKQVIGYVEYFGVQRVVLCLSDSYEGPDISDTYAINPITGEELSLIVKLHLSNEDIRDAYNYKKIPEGSVETAFDKVIKTGMKISFEKEKNRVLNQAVKYAFENCGAKEAEILMPQHINKITTLVMEKLKPFILHQFYQPQGKK